MICEEAVIWIESKIEEIETKMEEKEKDSWEPSLSPLKDTTEKLGQLDVGLEDVSTLQNSLGKRDIPSSSRKNMGLKDLQEIRAIDYAKEYTPLTDDDLEDLDTSILFRETLAEDKRRKKNIEALKASVKRSNIEIASKKQIAMEKKHAMYRKKREMKEWNERLEPFKLDNRKKAFVLAVKDTYQLCLMRGDEISSKKMFTVREQGSSCFWIRRCLKCKKVKGVLLTLLDNHTTYELGKCPWCLGTMDTLKDQLKKEYPHLF